MDVLQKCPVCRGTGLLRANYYYVLSHTEYEDIKKDAERHSMEIGDYIDSLVKNQRLADGQE